MVGVRFEYGAIDKPPSRDYGPYEYVQHTYTELRTPDDETLAFYESRENGGRLLWYVPDEAGYYSDIIIYAWKEGE